MSNRTQDIPRFFLAPQQERLFSLPEGIPATQVVAFLADGVSEPELRTALEQLVSMHEILRTTFVRVAGMRVPQQLIHDELPVAWTSSAAGGDHSLESVLHGEKAALDLEAGPILRAVVSTDQGSARALVLTAPAACLDGGSMVMLLRELGRLVREADTAEEPLQHADYAEWRRQLLDDPGPEADGALSWWRQQPAPSAPRLLFGRPSGGGMPSESLRFALRNETVVALRAAADSSRATEALFLETCAHALVARLSGDIELGLAGLVDGRSQPDLAGALGPYGQLVPIRSQVEPDTTFAELLDQVRRARADATRWQDYASSEQLALSTRAGIGFAYHELTLEDDLYPQGLAKLSTCVGPLAIEFVVYAGADTLAFELAYDPACYEAADVDRIAACFATLVESAAADSNLPVASLTLLDDDERAHVLALSAGVAAEVPASPVHHAFEERAAAAPHTVAVTDGIEQLTYGELNTAANQLAHRLRALGVGRDQAVALCFDRSPSAIVGLLGILKAGAAFVPLNFEHPQHRLAHQLREAEVVVLVTSKELLGRLPAFSGPSVCLDRDAQELAAEPSRDPEHVTELSDLAYVIYTSGSTGLPKGVAVTHRNVANYTARMLGRFEADGENLQFAVVSALSTDLGYTSVFPSLAGGGSIHLISPDVVMDPDAFAAYAAAMPIDVLKITPSLLTALLAADAGAVLPRRWLVSGGEQFTFDLLGRIRAHERGCRILNHYGPTETTIGTCVTEIVTGDDGFSANVPIGRPLDNSQAYIVDTVGQPTPLGVAGELWIGGAGVARGYVNRPDETAERFVANPFSSVPDAKAYRTGDRARFLPDGRIEFLGRVDQQVKIRGFRVEPGEIEATLLRHPGVRQAAVVVQGALDDLRLAAYVVASPQPSAEELRSFAGEWLPEYMIPSAFVMLDALPLTASGKVDRQALPDPATSNLRPGHEHVPPRTEVEHEIAEIWQELLGVEEVGVTDDFFALGGHSLLATQMITRIRRHHGNVPLRALFVAPTIAALAEAVGAAQASRSDAQ